MKSKWYPVFVIGLVFCLIASFISCGESPIQESIKFQLAEVSRIIDGDTIEVNINGDSYRVRYIGIDTPEIGEPFADEATDKNRELVEGQIVWLGLSLRWQRQ